MSDPVTPVQAVVTTVKKGVFNMTAVAIILAWLLTVAGSFFVGEKVNATHDEKLPPKYQYTYNIAESSSKSVASADNGQYTIIFNGMGGTNRYFNVSVKGLTNVNWSTAKTNLIKKTNYK